MAALWQLDASELFLPTLSLAEILVRAVLSYLGLCLLLRIIPKRQVGRSSISDILFVVLIGGIAVEAVVKEGDSLTDFLLMLTTILLLSYALDRAAYHVPWFRTLIQEPPTCLIRDGRILRENLRRELISQEDLLRELRRQDIEDLGHVREAQLEADGEISIVTTQERLAAPASHDGAPVSSSPREPTACSAELAGCAAQRNGRQPPLEREAGSTAASSSPGAADSAEDDPELRAFLAAAAKLQARLQWHQDQAARLKEALARHGVRPRAAVSDRRPHPANRSQPS